MNRLLNPETFYCKWFLTICKEFIIVQLLDPVESCYEKFRYKSPANAHVRQFKNSIIWLKPLPGDGLKRISLNPSWFSDPLKSAFKINFQLFSTFLAYFII